MIARFDDLLGRGVSTRALALLRVLAGPAALWHLKPYLTDTLDGETYEDAFNEQYTDLYPEFPEPVYIGLLWLGAVAAVAMSVGIAARVATATTFAVIAYNFFLSTTHFHNNAAYLVIVLAVLAAAPCGRELAFDAWIRRRRGLPPLDPTAPGWPLWVLRFECATVYGASGFSKLVDPDWFGGTVTWQRVVRISDDLEAAHLPDRLIDLLTNRDFHTGAAKFVVLTELFIALGLWWRRSRYVAVWVAVVFHVLIEITASVQIFSYIGICVLVIWSTPSTRDRVLLLDPCDRRQRRLGAVVRALDWLARFRIQPGPVLEVVDRDGTRVRGRSAVGLVLSRLPLTAWFAAPILALRLRTERATEEAHR